MDVPRQSNDGNRLIHLRVEALGTLLLFITGVAYVWLTWMTWPSANKNIPALAWVGFVVLVIGISIGYVFRNRCYALASRCLIWSGVAAIILLQVGFRASDLTYLFMLPIACTTMLLRRRDLVLVAGAAIIFLVAFNVYSGRTGLDWVIILLLVTASATLTTHHLNVALSWALESFEKAHHNAEVARQRQAELKQVLKALDTVSYSLARSNYLLTLARAQAEDGRRLKQQFAQNISHELRTPLNLIVGFTELMIQSPEYYGAALPPRYIRDLGVVHRNATHLQNLLNDVLDLARIESAQMALTPENVNIGELVRNSVEMARSLVEAKGLKLEVDIQPDLPTMCLDVTRIRQVLLNLINNATRFTDLGSVTVSARAHAHEIWIAVADTGIGIAESELSRIFEPFYQVDTDLRRKRGGAGLGLAISQQFVKLHHGRIWVESRLGQGSKFIFALPTQTVSLDDSPLPIVSQSYADLSPDKTKRVILVVTASSIAGSMLSRYLNDCQVMVTQNYDRAREIALRISPQIILIDDAYEQIASPVAVDELQNYWAEINTTVMVCPLPGEERLRQKLLADGYLIKPVKRENLWDMLRQFGENTDRLLVIDDDQDFVQLIKRILDQPLRRYQISEAHDGKTGLTMLDAIRPDLVLLDLELPDMHGSEVLRRIRERSSGQHIPVVVISATDDFDATVNVHGPIQLVRPGGWQSRDLIKLVQAMLEIEVGVQQSNAP